MKVDRITAQVRFSQANSHGAWKAVEIGAEATVDARERWAEALAHLYTDLGRELKVLWANGNSQKPQESPQDGSEATVEEPEHAQPLEHYCQQHQAEFKRYTRGNTAWWSHRKPDGKWCREGK